MTPEEQNELDQLKQSLRLTTAELADARGKLKAMELNVYETKRNAEKTLSEAKALQTETEQSLAVAADQMTVAHAIGLGIFGMAELTRARMARASAAARIVYRENHLVEHLERFVSAQTVGNADGVKQVLGYLKEKIAGIRHDGEMNRQIAAEQYLAHGFSAFETFWQKLLQESPK